MALGLTATTTPRRGCAGPECLGVDTTVSLCAPCCGAPLPLWPVPSLQGEDPKEEVPQDSRLFLSKGGGRANLEGTSALLPPLGAPSSEKGWYSLLRWGRNVPCVSYGLCPVRHWLLYIYASFFSRGILLPVTPALICPPPTWAPPFTRGSALFWVVRVGA